MLSPALSSRAGLVTAGFYAAIFLGIGIHLPFWPVWLEAWGLTPAEIGAYLGAGLVLRIGASALIGLIADRYALRRAALTVCGLASAVVFAAHLAAETKTVLFLLTLGVTATLSPMLPLAEALGLRAAQMHGFAYAHARAVGSVAFLVANIAMGWAIGTAGPDAALWGLMLCCLAAAGLGAVHPGGGAPPGEGVVDTARFGEGMALLADRRLALFALASALVQGSHATYYLYSALDWGARGIEPAMIGALWATGVVAETVLMLGPGRAWVARLDPVGALAVAALIAALRWAGMALEPALALLWPLQALHAFSFGFAHLAAMAFVARYLPLRLQASGQGLMLGLSAGLVMAALSFAAGAVQVDYGMVGAWWLAATAAGAAALAAVWLRRIGPPAQPADQA